MRAPYTNRPARLLALSLCFAPACIDNGGSDAGDESGGNGELDVPASYVFDSRFEDGSGVAYSGQTFRQALITSLKAEMSLIQEEIDNEAAVFAAGEVRARLEFYYLFDSETAGELPHAVSTDPAPLQSTWNDISSGKDLRAKIAGQDATGQHKDWSEGIVGWEENGGADDLISQWFDEVDALAVAYSSGNIPTSPDGVSITNWYVSAEGRDYQQLIQKLLLGAINYSQGSDDYLDDDLDGKGLNANNNAPDGEDEGEPEAYSALEHAWDEGFGYWGGARDYLAYDDETLAASSAHDHDGDGAIDLLSEYNFGASINAAKRDAGASADAPTDFTHETMTAFLTGRAIITHADGELSSEAMSDLQAQRDIAVLGWEKSLAATTVHYINDTLADLSGDDVAFEDIAKHWSELKGFALSLQFNPRKQINDSDFATLNELIGTEPGMDDVASYKADLVSARDILASAYGFATENLGDANGEGGW
jgi:hypothetical protein